MASGNHPLEAIIHGLCEVVERDAITLWLMHGLREKAATTLDLASVEDRDCKDLLSRLRKSGVEVLVWNTTSDIGIPTYYCLIRGASGEDVDPEFGGGCHPCREIALMRAVTEAVQARTTFIAGSRDDFGPRVYSSKSRGDRMRSCQALVNASKPALGVADTPSHDSAGLNSDFRWLLGRLRAAGYDHVVCVDLTLEEFDIPVVRVMVPGLEGVFKGPGSDYVPGERAQRSNGSMQ